MLYSLYIKNFAIIDEIKVTFENGLNVITGETGVGKTLIIKAIQFLLGERFKGEVLIGDSSNKVEFNRSKNFIDELKPNFIKNSEISAYVTEMYVRNGLTIP